MSLILFVVVMGEGDLPGSTRGTVGAAFHSPNASAAGLCEVTSP